jgi:hypothetical protein
MKNENEIRSRKLTLCLNAKEYQLMLDSFQRTTCRNLGEYIRKMVLSKPIRVNVRNESLDELMIELIKLRSDLNRITENVDAPLRWPLIADLKSGIGPDHKDEPIQRLLLLAGQINKHITGLAKTWLQS